MDAIEQEIEALKHETLAMLQAGKMEPDPIPWPWERRRENELTPDYLGRVLDGGGFRGLAERARMAHFDDFHAPAEVATGAELLHLVAELRIEARERPELAEYAAAVENAARRGEFDATKAESDRWMASADGQRTMGMLVRSAAQGRNEACACGSGRKFKRCCGA